MSWNFWTLFGRSRTAKAKKPELAKRIRRKARLDFESLEKRWLFSTSAWLPRAPIVVGAASNFSQDPFFGPVSPLLNPEYAAGGNLRRHRHLNVQPACRGQ